MTLDPSSWPGGGGGGLPASWIDDGHGAVTAATDGENATTLEIDAVVGQTAAPLAVRGTTNDLLRLTESEAFISSGGAAGGNRTRLALDASGDANLLVADGGAINLFGGNSGPAIFIKDGLDTPQRIEAFGYLKVRSGTLLLTLHSAPADADLNAGECALWFDQTNGAAKLMVKAKQADGTVRTGSLALA